jgi:hypothetical protein
MQTSVLGERDACQVPQLLTPERIRKNILLDMRAQLRCTNRGYDLEALIRNSVPSFATSVLE